MSELEFIYERNHYANPCFLTRHVCKQNFVRFDYSQLQINYTTSSLLLLARVKRNDGLVNGVHLSSIGVLMGHHKPESSSMAKMGVSLVCFFWKHWSETEGQSITELYI